MTTVQQICDLLHAKAPFDTAEEWDNSGLLVGDKAVAVSTVYVSLDITAQTVARAAAAGAQLMVSHHPVIFDPLKALPATHLVYQLVKQGIGALCVHTNLDKAVGGVNDQLALQLGLDDIRVAPDGMSRIGQLSTPMTADGFSRHVSAALATAVRARVGTDTVRTVALCGGAGADLVLPLLSQADAAVTGEVKHHQWLDIDPAKTLIDGGHYFTENGVVAVLAAWLREAFPDMTVIQGEQAVPYITLKD